MTLTKHTTVAAINIAFSRIHKKRVIGQNVLVKTAVVVEISTATAVISFLKEDTGWTKRVGENACNS